MQIQNALLTGSTTVYGPITFVSGTLVGSSSYAATSSYADTFTVAGSLTAQTLVVQTITSSVSFITGSTRFGSLLTNTHTFTGSMFLTGSAINVNNSKVIIGDDGTYGGNISTVGFGGTSNGFNRIAAANNTSDGIYLIAATGRGVYIRPGGKSTQDLSVFPNGNTALGVNFLLPTATLHISGSGSGSLMQISSTVSSSIFFVSGSGNIGIGMADPTVKLDVSGSVTDANGGIIKIRSGASDASIRIGVTSSYSWIQAHGSKPLYINELGNNTILNLGGSNVGIGTSNPGGTLEVANLSAGVTVGDFLVNTTSKYVYVGRQSSTSGDNTTFVVRDRTGTARATIPGGGSLDTVFSTNNSNFNVTNYGGTSFFFISGSGNIGIGTTSPDTLLTVNGTTGTKSFSLTNSGGGTRADFTITENTGLILNVNEGATTRGLYVQTGGVDRFTVLAGGSVGINTTSPAQQLHVYNTSNYVGALINGSNAPQLCFAQGVSTSPSWKVGISGNDGTAFSISSGSVNADKLFISKDGNVGINNTNPQARLHIAGAGGSEISFAIYDGSSRRTFFIPSQYYGYMWACEIASNGGKAWSFGSAGGGGEVGTIVVNASSTAYNTTSDYRLKEDLKDFNGLELLSKIKVYDFKWKKEDARTHGAMAHELQEILPYAVSGEKDAINHEGKIEAQSVDYSKIVPTLVKAIQELSTKLEEATTRIKTLESK